MNKLIEHFVPAHDPILGIKAANVAASLDSSNWQSKAIMLNTGDASLYIFLNQARCTRERKSFYCVNTFDVDNGAMLSMQLFPTPEEAFTCVNQRMAGPLVRRQGCNDGMRVRSNQI